MNWIKGKVATEQESSESLRGSGKFGKTKAVILTERAPLLEVTQRPGLHP